MARPQDNDPDSFVAIRPRMFVVAGVFIVLFLILLAGLFKVQILDYSGMMEQQQRQNYRRILIPGPRGDIRDRDGRLLVGNRPLFSAVVYLNELRKEFRREYLERVRDYRESGIVMKSDDVEIESRQAVVQRYMDKVNVITGRHDVVSSRDIERHFSRDLLLPFTLKDDIPQEEYARLIEQLPVDSPVQILTESARYYPYGRMAAHTLGFVVSSDDTYDTSAAIGNEDLRTFKKKGKAGRTGLELQFDDILQGDPGGEIWVVDPSGFQHKRVDFRRPVKGSDIVTSLDADLQLAAEKALGSHTGAVVVMDIKTGEILALASEPAYDLNDLTPFIPTKVYNDIRDRGAWINRATQGLYPPGSTFKMVTATAAYRAGTLTETMQINCPGYLTIGGRRFHNDDKTDHGLLDVRHAIAESNNVFFYTLGVQTGIDAIADTARMYGFDKPTGIELPGETSRSVVPDADYKKRRFGEGWFTGDTANASIGQGYLLVTPLQLCTYTASLARRRTITHPTLLKVDPAHPRDLGGEPLPLTDSQYASLMDGMRLCVTQGTGILAQRKVNMPIAGKTGTAQIYISGRESTIAWFTCFAPSYDPRIAVTVMIEGLDPGENLFGGSTSGPIAREVLKAWENKYLSPTPAAP
jgi:penicillin-binding protein 2